MFNNIGGKIKGVAKLITWIGIITSVLAFLFICTIEDGKLTGLGFIILIVGCIISWLSSLTLYGFGQLIENSDILVGKSNPKHFTKENDPYSYPDERSFEQVVDSLDISYESKARLKELKEWYNDDLIDGPNCCDRIRQILANQPEKMVVKIISKL